MVALQNHKSWCSSYIYFSCSIIFVLGLSYYFYIQWHRQWNKQLNYLGSDYSKLSSPNIFPLAMFIDQCPSGIPLPPFSFLSCVTSQGNCGFVSSPNQNLTHHNLVCGVNTQTMVIINPVSRFYLESQRSLYRFHHSALISLLWFSVIQ